MIKFKTFENCIQTIKDSEEKDAKLIELIGEGISTYYTKLSANLVDVLGEIFEDTDDWLSWWLWDCDFGTRFCTYRKKDGEEDIDLSNLKTFYNFLLENKS